MFEDTLSALVDAAAAVGGELAEGDLDGAAKAAGNGAEHVGDAAAHDTKQLLDDAGAAAGDTADAVAGAALGFLDRVAAGGSLHAGVSSAGTFVAADVGGGLLTVDAGIELDADAADGDVGIVAGGRTTLDGRTGSEIRLEIAADVDAADPDPPPRAAPPPSPPPSPSPRPERSSSGPTAAPAANWCSTRDATEPPATSPIATRASVQASRTPATPHPR